MVRMQAAVMLVLSAVLAGSVVLLLADQAEATHYWGGSLKTSTPGQGLDVDGLLGHVAGQAFVGGQQSWRWSALGSLPVCSTTTGEGALQYADSTTSGSASFQRVITRVDPGQDLATVRIVASGTGSAACNAPLDDTTYDVYIQFGLTLPGSPAGPAQVWWTSCCRLSYGGGGNYHVNNNDQSEFVRAWLNLGEENKSPIAELASFHTCAVDALCRFNLNAADPDGDALTHRLATSDEASPGGTFHQPGPSCPRCAPVQDGLTIDKATGTIEWDTTGAELVDTCDPGEAGCPASGRRVFYSAQVIIEDARDASAPHDFMIMLVDEPYTLCGDGSMPVWENGKWTCPPPPPNQPPQAAFTHEAAGLRVTFTDGSSDADGHVVARSWSFGDGTTTGWGNKTQLVHTYAQSGTYTVYLNVRDDDGAYSYAYQRIQVANAPPKADFTFTTDGLTATFSDASVDADGSVTQWIWTFGDGTSAQGSAVNHTYAWGGTYNVTLTAYDAHGAKDSITKAVTVAAPPVASFTYDASGLNVDFQDTSGHPDTALLYWYWTFGDGTNSTLQNPTHRFAPGTYTVTLLVIDTTGATSRSTQTLHLPCNGNACVP